MVFFSFVFKFAKSQTVCKVSSFLETQQTFGSGQKQQNKYINTNRAGRIFEGGVLKARSTGWIIKGEVGGGGVALDVANVWKAYSEMF